MPRCYARYSCPRNLIKIDKKASEASLYLSLRHCFVLVKHESVRRALENVSQNNQRAPLHKQQRAWFAVSLIYEIKAWKNETYYFMWVCFWGYDPCLCVFST